MTTDATSTLVERSSARQRLRMLFGRGEDVRDELEGLHIERSKLGWLPIGLLVVLLAALIVSGALAVATGTMTGQLFVSLLATSIAVVGVLVAVLQWRLGLSEKAFDALYARIGLANEMRLKAEEGAKEDDDAAKARNEERYRFFVFTEIDSLEYAVRRYEFGLGMTADITGRAVRHFRSRCEDPKFREVALACAVNGAYFTTTKELVSQIIDEEGGGTPAEPPRADPS